MNLNWKIENDFDVLTGKVDSTKILSAWFLRNNSDTFVGIREHIGQIMDRLNSFWLRSFFSINFYQFGFGQSSLDRVFDIVFIAPGYMNIAD